MTRGICGFILRPIETFQLDWYELNKTKTNLYSPGCQYVGQKGKRDHKIIDKNTQTKFKKNGLRLCVGAMRHMSQLLSMVLDFPLSDKELEEFLGAQKLDAEII